MNLSTPPRTNRRGFLATGAASLAIALLAIGCGGSGDTEACVKTNPEALAVLKGRFVEGPQKTPVVGIFVTAGGASMTTAEDGAFTFSVPACATGGYLKANLPESGGAEIYNDHVVVDGATWEIQNHGWPVPELNENTTKDLGDIVLTRVSG